MQFAQDQISELKKLFGNEMKIVQEGTYTFIYIPNQKISGGIDTEYVDLLFCPTPWGGYHSRLFFSRQVKTSASRNWNNANVRIVEKNWFAFSWQIEGRYTLVETVMIYLREAR